VSARIDRRLLAADPRGRAMVAGASAAALTGGLLLIAQTVLVARMIASAFAGDGAAALAGPALAVALLVAVRGLLAWTSETGGRLAAQRLMSALRLQLAERRLAAPVPLDNAESAAVATAAVAGADELEAYFARYLPQLLLAVMVPPAVLLVAALTDLESAFVMLLTLPLVPIFMVLIGRLAEARARARWQELTTLSGHFLDVLGGLTTLRAFNRGEAQAERIAEVDERYRGATMATLRVAFLSGAVLDLAAVVGTALVAVTLGVRLDDGGVGLEPALIVLMLTPELYAPLRGLGAQFHASADGLAAAERMLAQIDATPTPAQRGTALPEIARFGVSLESVTFAYPARPQSVIRGLSLEIAPGETVAVTGPSGSGKSTLAALLLGFVQPAEGAVRCGELDLTRCDGDLWRTQIAWLPQRPSLFAGSVADAIRLGDPFASRREVAAAARASGADVSIRLLPQGYDTPVGEGGRQLSLGEVRRVALARALIRQAPLLILDEPTADLDAEAAAVVTAAIERAGQDRAVLVITHRPEPAAIADRVLRVESGRIAAAPGVPA
jgi:ATP-binding cassette, subfamily C, bacterial CydD